jgi:hypothetical protein
VAKKIKPNADAPAEASAAALEAGVYHQKVIVQELLQHLMPLKYSDP